MVTLPIILRIKRSSTIRKMYGKDSVTAKSYVKSDIISASSFSSSSLHVLAQGFLLYI